jgi:hypothetical protein
VLWVAGIPAFAGMTRTRSIEPAEKVGEIALARLLRRRFEGTAERGGDAGMGGRNVDSDDRPIHVEFRCRKLFTFCVHMRVTMPRRGSFVRFSPETGQEG